MPVAFKPVSVGLHENMALKGSVSPEKPGVFRDFSGVADVLLITRDVEDYMAMIIRLSKTALNQFRCAGFPSPESLRYAPDFSIVREGVEVVQFEPLPGRFVELAVEHSSDGAFN